MWDALTREFLIGGKIDHAKDAKDANPTTLLTRFAEELRRAPEAGGGEKSDYSFDLEVFSEVSFRSCL